MIPACKLWEKVFAKGNRYLIGRMGGVRVMVMTNTRPEDENDASNVLMFAEPPQYNQSQAAPDESSHPAPASMWSRSIGCSNNIARWPT